MAGYLERYGAGEERREKLIKWTIVSLVVVLIAGALAWFFFRDYAEQLRVRTFFDLLRRSEYSQAYSLWGCTETQPCPQYAFNKFLEDWGPQSKYSNVSEARLTNSKSCQTGIIQFVEFPNQPQLQLWVERENKVLGFAPWPVCNPRMPAP